MPAPDSDRPTAAPQSAIEPQWVSAPRQFTGERQAAHALQLCGPD